MRRREIPEKGSRKLRALFALALVVLLGAASALPAGAAEKLRFAMPGKGLSYFPVVIADWEGYFREYGIKPEIIVAMPNVAISGLVSGDVNFMGSAVDVLAAGVRGLPVKLIYLIAGPQHTLAVKDGKRFPTVRSLAGQPIAVNASGSILHFLAMEAFEQAGLDPKKDLVILVAKDPSARFAALSRGLAPAAVLDLAGTIMAEREGFTILQKFASSVALPLSGLGMEATAYKEHPDLVRKVDEATRKGSSLINDPKARDEVIRLVTRWNGFTRAQAARALTLAEGSFTKDGKIRRDQIATTNKFLRFRFPKKKDIDVSRYIDPSIIEK